MKSAILFLAVSAYVPHHPVGATGEAVLPNLTAAVSREYKHLLGTWVHVDGHGVRYINDITNARIKHTIDLAVACKDEAREIGRQKGRRVTR